MKKKAMLYAAGMFVTGVIDLIVWSFWYFILFFASIAEAKLPEEHAPMPFYIHIIMIIGVFLALSYIIVGIIKLIKPEINLAKYNIIAAVMLLISWSYYILGAIYETAMTFQLMTLIFGVFAISFIPLCLSTIITAKQNKSDVI